MLYSGLSKVYVCCGQTVCGLLCGCVLYSGLSEVYVCCGQTVCGLLCGCGSVKIA